MKRLRISRPTPSIIISCLALFAALGGTSYAADSAMNGGSSMGNHGSSMGNHGSSMSSQSGSAWASHLGGLPSKDYMLAKHTVSSNGVQFLNAGQTMTLGHAGHFTFSAVCSADPTGNGSQSVTFEVTSNTEASLDGNGPMPAGSVIQIHVDSDQLDSTTAAPLTAGDFAQVASASSSTEIAQDGQEADIFYTDGVNWGQPGSSGSHACFAGFTGFLYGGKSMSSNNPNSSPPPFSGTHT